MNSSSSKIYEFKITLQGVKPTVWRRVQIPDNFNFYQLHEIIYDLMGWGNYRMYFFKIRDPITQELIEIQRYNFMKFNLYECKVLIETEVRLKDLFSLANNVAYYQYDQGCADWSHEVKLVKIVNPRLDGIYPRLVDGRRAYPPEQCDGASGYSRLCKIIKNPAHTKYRETIEILARLRGQQRPFDPNHFDKNEIRFSGTIVEYMYSQN